MQEGGFSVEEQQEKFCVLLLPRLHQATMLRLRGAMFDDLLSISPASSASGGCWGCCPLSRANFAENVQKHSVFEGFWRAQTWKIWKPA